MTKRPSEPPLQVVSDQEPDPYAVARTIVLRQLTASAKSRRQLAETLRARGVPEQVATAVLDRMSQVGLVDDCAYAAQLIATQQRTRGLARRALAQELHRKGIDELTASAALDQIDPHREEERARLLISKKIATLHGQPAPIQTRRLAGLLARKGYPAELSRRLVQQAVANTAEHQRD